jgi:hypothetical protein
MAEDRWQPDSFDDLLDGLMGGLPELAGEARDAEFGPMSDLFVDLPVAPLARPPRDLPPPRAPMFAAALPEAPPIDFGPAPVGAEEDADLSATTDPVLPDSSPPGNQFAPHGDAIRDALSLLKQLTRDTAEIRELLKRREAHDRPAHFAPPMYL